MEKVTLIPYESIYENFIDKKYLHDGLDEYYFRNQQTKNLQTIGVICVPTRLNVL